MGRLMLQKPLLIFYVICYLIKAWKPFISMCWIKLGKCLLLLLPLFVKSGQTQLRAKNAPLLLKELIYK
jgi:hypothetical protein